MALDSPKGGADSPGRQPGGRGVAWEIAREAARRKAARGKAADDIPIGDKIAYDSK